MFQLKTHLGLAIQSLAAGKGLRQAELARLMKRKPGTVSQWWRGKVMPDTESLIQIADALDTSHTALMEEAQRRLEAITGKGLARPVAIPEPLDADARKLGEHLARSLTEALVKYPQRRASLIKHWYGQIEVTLWEPPPTDQEPPESRAPKQRRARRPEGTASPKRRAG